MIGQTVGNYRVTAKIGEGGMGAVYLAEHALIGRKAAIKSLLPQFCHSEQLVTRFFNEAKAATAVRHPGIVEVYDFGYAQDGSAFIVMEYLEGESLQARIRRGTMPIEQVLNITSQIASALAAAHAQGIVHRDLKPDNVFLVPDRDIAGGERAKLLDFGIAKLTEDQGASVKTRTGAVLGTPAYMSPEQCRGTGQVSYPSDLYSVGCIVHEMLCGQPPFYSEGTGEVLAKHMFEAPRPLAGFVPGLPPQLSSLVLRLLAKAPQERPPSAEHLKLEVDAIRQGPPSAPGYAATPTSKTVAAPPHMAGHTPPPPEPRTTISQAAAAVPTSVAAPRRARWIAPVIAAVVLAGGGVALALFVTGNGNAGDEREAAAATATETETARPAESEQKPEVTEPDTAASDPQPAPESPAETDPPQPAEISITIKSKPPGATVYQRPGNMKVGNTPYELKTKPGQGSLVFVLEKSGYDEMVVEVPATGTLVRDVELVEKTKHSRNKRTRSKTAKPDEDSGKLNPFDRDRKNDKLNPFDK